MIRRILLTTAAVSVAGGSFVLAVGAPAGSARADSPPPVNCSANLDLSLDLDGEDVPGIGQVEDGAKQACDTARGLPPGN